MKKFLIFLLCSLFLIGYLYYCEAGGLIGPTNPRPTPSTPDPTPTPTPTSSWDALYGGNAEETAYAIIETSDGGLIVAGECYSDDITPDKGSNSAESDMYIVKLASDGTKEWDAMYGGNDWDMAHSIAQTSDGGYIIAGSSWSSDITPDQGANSASSDITIVKIDSTGTLSWTAMYGGGSEDRGYCVIQTDDGGYIVAGASHSSDITPDYGSNEADFDYWVIKLDSSGAESWDYMTGGSSADYAYSIVEPSSGEFVIAGESASSDISPSIGTNATSSDYYIVRINSTGTMLWDAMYGGNDHDKAYSIVSSSSGGFLVAGSSWSSDISPDYGANVYSTDYYLVKINDSGVKEWDAMFGGNDLDYARAVVETSGGSYLIAGYSASTDITPDQGDKAGYYDFLIYQVANNGTLEQTAIFGSDDDEECYAVCVTSDGKFVTAGLSETPAEDLTPTNGTNEDGTDYYIVKSVE